MYGPLKINDLLFGGDLGSMTLYFCFKMEKFKNVDVVIA
jgi:hypothetical protein